jgi:hypothetical protein
MKSNDKTEWSEKSRHFILLYDAVDACLDSVHCQADVIVREMLADTLSFEVEANCLNVTAAPFDIFELLTFS